jgi:L-lactate dehydrogenase complex protein LldG
MSSRDDILASIRANRPRAERPLPTVRFFDADRPTSLVAAFKESLERMGGLFLDPTPTGDVLAPVRAKIANAKVVCSIVPEIARQPRHCRGLRAA